MKKYCLSYDARASEEWQGNELKMEILKILIVAGASNIFETPVASTILFYDKIDSNRISYWEGAILNQFVTNNNRIGTLKSGIYYYLCMIMQDRNDNYIEKKSANPSLAISLKEILDQL